MNAKTLYQICTEEGIPTKNHYSDLYIPVTPRTRELVKGYHAHVFTNAVEGGAWFDVPFAFDPYWDARGVLPVKYASPS